MIKEDIEKEMKTTSQILRLVRARGLHLLLDVLLEVLHLALGLLNLRLELRLLVVRALLLLLELLLVVLEVLVLRVRRARLGLAPVAVRNVSLLLLAQRDDHLVDVGDDRVEVPRRLDRGRDRREAEGASLRRH